MKSLKKDCDRKSWKVRASVIRAKEETEREWKLGDTWNLNICSLNKEGEVGDV